MKERVKFIKVNIDESPELVKKLYILKVPSFIVYKDGKSVARYHDFMDKSQMAAFIEKFILDYSVINMKKANLHESKNKSF